MDKPTGVELLPIVEQAISIRNLNAYFGDTQVLFNIDHQFPKGEITAIMGPSGCGKSVLLRCINGTNLQIPTFKADGSVEVHQSDFEGLNTLNGHRINDVVSDIHNRVEALLFALFGQQEPLDYERLRRKVGMVYQKPVMFPNLSLAENVLTSARKHPIIRSQEDAQRILEHSLKQAGIWNEVRAILDNHQGLSGGQEQRMTIARALATDPEVILMDEPTAKLDPKNSPAVEETILKLKEEGKTIIIVTHNGEQAVRLSDNIVFLHQGEIIEKGKTQEVAEHPKQALTRQFLKGSTLDPLPKRKDFKADDDWRLSVAEQLKHLDILKHVCFELGLSPAQLDTDTAQIVEASINEAKKHWIERIKTIKANPDMIVTFITNAVLEKHKAKMLEAKSQTIDGVIKTSVA